MCQLYTLPAFDTVPRGGNQALLLDAAPDAAITLTVRAAYPAQATLYTDSSLGLSNGFGTTLTGKRVAAGYRYSFRVGASGLALLTFAIPHNARQGRVIIQVTAQEHGARARRVLRVTYHAHAHRAATVKAGAAHRRTTHTVKAGAARTRPHTLFGAAGGTGT